MRTQVAIIGAGPAGLLAGQLLYQAGIDNIIIEHQSAAHVLSRIRAGVLEQTTVDLLERAGIGARMRREGLLHRGFDLSIDGTRHRIDLHGLTGGQGVMVYGQTEVTRDLMAARAAAGLPTHYEVADVSLHDFDTARPSVRLRIGNDWRTIDCDFIAGCDGYHGPSRASVPAGAIRLFEKTFPFGWLGVLSDTPPVSDELIYSTSARGFALCSMRSRSRSRYYVQCALDQRVEQWSDAAFWDELRRRLDPATAAGLVTGPSIEKSITPLRSFVAEPMRFGRLLLAGDAAHIVPPTGAKGLNLAASDVDYLTRAVIDWYRGDPGAIDQYSGRCLARVWKAVRFSCWFTSLMHRFPGSGDFEHRLQWAERDYLVKSPTASKVLADNYVGLAL